MIPQVTIKTAWLNLMHVVMATIEMRWLTNWCWHKWNKSAFTKIPISVWSQNKDIIHVGENLPTISNGIWLCGGFIAVNERQCEKCKWVDIVVKVIKV